MAEAITVPAHTPLGDALLRHQRAKAAPDVDGLCAKWQKRLASRLNTLLPGVQCNVECDASGAFASAPDGHDVALVDLGADDMVRIVVSRQTFLGLVAISMGGDDDASSGRHDRSPSDLEYAIAAHVVERMMSPLHAILVEAGWTGTLGAATWVKPQATEGVRTADVGLAVTCRLRSWVGVIAFAVPSQLVGLVTSVEQISDATSGSKPPAGVPRFAGQATTRLDVHLSASPIRFADVLALRVGDVVALTDPSARRVAVSCSDQLLFTATLARQGQALVARIDAPITVDVALARQVIDRF